MLDRRRKVGRGDVNFIGQLARETDSHHNRRGDANEGFPHRQPAEMLSRSIATRNRRQDVARLWARHNKDRLVVGQRPDLHVLAHFHILNQPVHVVKFRCGCGPVPGTRRTTVACR